MSTKKVLVLASSYGQYMYFCRQFKLNPRKDVRYVTEWMDMCGYWIDQPVIMLEGYEYNRSYTIDTMARIGHRFENISFISEGELYESTQF